jgi:hypothetical protein
MTRCAVIGVQLVQGETVEELSDAPMSGKGMPDFDAEAIVEPADHVSDRADVV